MQGEGKGGTAWIMEMLKAFIHIKVTEQHNYNSNIGCVLIYLQGGTTNEIRM